MRATILLTDDDGKTYRAEVEFQPEDATAPSPRALAPLGNSDGVRTECIDFSLSVRPFMKRYGNGLRGPKRFVLLVAYLTKGNGKASVSLKDTERVWNKMKPIMGGPFNPAYSARAREEGWVEAPQYGMYTVRPEWKEILS